jgi:microcystin-dependent protein
MKAQLAAALLATLAAFASPAFANVPALMSYQGRVSDASGTLIGNSAPVNRVVTFKFYSASSGGTALYAESQTVTISGGEFSVLVGAGTGISGLPGPSAPATAPYIALSSIMTGNVYLGITVDDGTTAADPEITPRQQIVSAAYAFRAKFAEGLLDGALSTAMLANSSVTTDKIGGGSITSAKLANDAVTTANIASGSINESRLANGSVTTDKIASGSVNSDKIANGTVTTSDIADGQINSAKIADGSIASGDIADGAIVSADIGTGAIANDKVANGAIDYNKLAAALQQSLCPAGTILPYAGDAAPSGWFLCDGTVLNRTTYSTLFNVVGTRFGTTASDNFRIPDLRGQFLRGRDGGAGRDPDRASRTAMNSGGSTGDAVGSIQSHTLGVHNHGYQDIYYSEGGGSVSVTSNRGSGDTDYDNSGYQMSRATDNTGGNETRPTNANVNYIIKM